MSALADVRWISLPSIADERGVLTAVESGRDIPFEIRRIFFMHQVVADRGGHAHRETDQVIVAVAGSFRVDLADGTDTRTYVLDDATRGLFVPRMIFARLYDFSAGAVCLVLADCHYDAGMSIRNWGAFLQEVEKRGRR